MFQNVQFEQINVQHTSNSIGSTRIFQKEKRKPYHPYEKSKTNENKQSSSILHKLIQHILKIISHIYDVTYKSHIKLNVSLYDHYGKSLFYKSLVISSRIVQRSPLCESEYSMYQII